MLRIDVVHNGGTTQSIHRQVGGGSSYGGNSLVESIGLADAQAVAASLLKKKFPAFVISPTSDKYFHVQVGPYSDPKSAEAAKKGLENAGHERGITAATLGENAAIEALETAPKSRGRRSRARRPNGARWTPPGQHVAERIQIRFQQSEV